MKKILIFTVLAVLLSSATSRSQVGGARALYMSHHSDLTHSFLASVPVPDTSHTVAIPATVMTEKKPAIALGLSMLVPGAGQVYNGQIAKGLVFAGLFYGGIAMVSAANITRAHKSITGYGWMCIFTIAGSHIWNMIDAATTAQTISDEAARQGHALEMNIGNHAFMLDAAIVPRAAAVRVEIGI